MRNDAEARQGAEVERLLSKAIMNLPEGMDRETMAVVVGNISNAMLETYMLGALEAMQGAPWEVTEVAHFERVEPRHMLPMVKQGWEPWDIANVMAPPNPLDKTGNSKSRPGFLVRYKRRLAPGPLPANTDER